jgi:hypothetical protein
MRAGQEPFAGDLVLRLAEEGWLVLPPEQAERLVTELERALDDVRSCLRNAELSFKLLGTGDEVDQLVVDCAFAGQISADRWEQALVELPKYIRAFRIAAGTTG